MGAKVVLSWFSVGLLLGCHMEADLQVYMANYSGSFKNDYSTIAGVSGRPKSCQR